MGAVLPWPAAVPVWLTQSQKLRYVTDYNRVVLWQRRVVQSVVGREERFGARDDLQAHRIWLTGSLGVTRCCLLLVWQTATRGLDFDNISHLNAAECHLSCKLQTSIPNVPNPLIWSMLCLDKLQYLNTKCEILCVRDYRLIQLLVIIYIIYKLQQIPAWPINRHKKGCYWSSKYL